MKPQKISINNKVELAENNLQRVNEWIANSDTKIGFVITFQIALVAFLATKGTEIKNILLKKNIFLVEIILYFSIFLFIFFIIKSMIYSFRTLFPDITIRKPSLFFFASIAQIKEEEFNNNFKSMSEEMTLDELNSQVYINSTIANKKMISIRIAIVNFVIAAAFWLISLVLLPWMN